MAADADATFGMQAGFPLSLATRVLKYTDSACRIPIPKDDVGDQLLKRWIFLHVRPWQITRLRGFEQSPKVPVDISGKALKVAQAVKVRGRDN